MKRSLFIIVSLLTGQMPAAIAQRPTHVPGAGEPTPFFESPGSVILYIIIPLIIGLLYFIWRRNLKKEQDKNRSRE